MISMIQGLARLCVASAVVSAFLPIGPTYAQVNVAFVSPTGTGSNCTATAPCATIADAFERFLPPLRVICLDGATPDTSGVSLAGAISNGSFDIDCPLGFEGMVTIPSFLTNVTMRIRHLDFGITGNTDQIVFDGSGTLVLEDCVFTDATGGALDIEPNGPLNLVIKNSRISSNAGGILFKPAAGGSITATLDHVTIANNTPGGGLKIDTTNGPVTVDVTDSIISDNAADGINVVGNAGGQAMVSIKNSVIAKDGQQGVVANGANAAVLLQMTLLDQNAAGATSVVSGGHISTYGNNSIVGSAGSGFTTTVPLQ